MSALRVEAMLRELDPERDAAAMVHLRWEVLTPPRMAHLGYVASTLRTVAAPRVAERLLQGGAGKQLRAPQRRDRDTLGTFAQLIRHGHDSAHGRALCAQMAAIHARVGGIETEDLLYTLGMLIFAGTDLGVRLGAAPLPTREQRALLRFWSGVGRQMGLDPPDDAREFQAFLRDYEARLFRPSPSAHVAAEAHLAGLAGWLPGPLLAVGRRLVLAALPDHVVTCLGYPRVGRLDRVAARFGYQAALRAARLRTVRLDASWQDAVPASAPRAA